MDLMHNTESEEVGMLNSPIKVCNKVEDTPGNAARSFSSRAQ